MSTLASSLSSPHHVHLTTIRWSALFIQIHRVIKCCPCSRMASRYISRRYGGGVTSSSSSYSSTSLSSSASQSTNSYSSGSSTRARSQVSLVTGGDHGDHVVQVREAPPLPPASQWARARSCGPPGREREYYTEHSSSGMQVSTLCWLYNCGQPFCPKLSAKKEFVVRYTFDF